MSDNNKSNCACKCVVDPYRTNCAFSSTLITFCKLIIYDTYLIKLSYICPLIQGCSTFQATSKNKISLQEQILLVRRFLSLTII